jgi:hypothetical protein
VPIDLILIAALMRAPERLLAITSSGVDYVRVGAAFGR